MRKLLELMAKIHDRLCYGCFVLGAVLVFCLCLIIGYEVVVRYFFSRPTAWALDFSEYILIYGCFLTIPWLLKKGEHVSVNIIIDSLGEKSRSILNAVSSLVGTVIFVVISVQGFLDTWDTYTRGVVILRPIIVKTYLIMWVIPFGTSLLCIYFLRKTFSALQSIKRAS